MARLSSHKNNNKVSKPSNTPRKLTSNLWAWAADVVDGKPPLGVTPGLKTKEVYRCRLCVEKDSRKPREWNRRGGGAHFREHILKKHQITVPTCTEEEKQAERANAQTANGQIITDMSSWNLNMRSIAANQPPQALQVEQPDEVLDQPVPIPENSTTSTAKTPVLDGYCIGCGFWVDLIRYRERGNTVEDVYCNSSRDSWYLVPDESCEVCGLRQVAQKAKRASKESAVQLFEGRIKQLETAGFVKQMTADEKQAMKTYFGKL